MAKKINKAVGRKKSTFTLKETKQSQKIILESELSRKAIRAALAFREATHKAAIDINGYSVPSKRARNRLHEYCRKKFGTRIKKAELVILMNINSTQWRVLTRKDAKLREINKTLNNLVNNTFMRPTNITLKNFITSKQTASQFASNSMSNSVDETYWNDVYNEDLQKLLSSAFNEVQ